MPDAGDSDPTIRLRPVRPIAGSRRNRLPALVAAILAVTSLAGGAWFLLQPPPPPPAVIAPAAPPVAAPAIPIRTATEAEIRDNTAGPLTVFRFAANPHVLVLDFAALHEQGMMLNRVAALVEKAGLPHDRVLNDAELDAAIRAHGDTPETYYYGHDYSAATLARFFALAERDHVALTPQEQWLHRLLEQEGDLQPGVLAALISIPQAGVDKLIDAGARATILHHELSHGEYFSNPAYATYAQRFWKETMTPGDRALFTRFLTAEDYDPNEQDLMINETQAYLMHTPDPRFFNAAAVGMTPDALNRLQASFLVGMPKGWLRDCTVVPPTLPR